MTVRYHSRNGHLCPEYVCQREGIEHAEPVCQRVPGVGIDQAIGELDECVDGLLLLKFGIPQPLQFALRRLVNISTPERVI